MKKIVALMLAFVMMAAASLTAFADVTPAEHYKPNPEKKLTVDGETGLVEVTYEVSAKWQILIPADVVFVETYGLKFLADVEAQSARIPIGQTLTLTVESANGYKMINTTSESDSVPYAVSFVKNNVMLNVEYVSGDNNWNFDISVLDTIEIKLQNGYGVYTENALLTDEFGGYYVGVYDTRESKVNVDTLVVVKNNLCAVDLYVRDLVIAALDVADNV